MNKTRSLLVRFGALALIQAAVFAVSLPINSHAVVFSDANNDTFTNGDANLDIASVEVTNDGVNLVIAVTTRGFATWTKYLIWIDTPDKANAPSNSNGWGRPASMAAGEGADFFIGSWVDATPGNAQLWEYATSWNQHSSSPLTNLISGNTVTFTIPLSTLGLSGGSAIKLDVATSGGGGSDPGVDHASLSTAATTGWGVASTGGPMLSYTVAAVADSDNDGLPDTWENTYFGNLAQTGSGDADSDGLTNAGELTAGTNPTVADTDTDGLTDGAEVNTHTTNPLVADTDGDGVNDGAEVTAGTNPKKTNYSQITVAGSWSATWGTASAPAPAVDGSNVLSAVPGDEFGWQLNFRMTTAGSYLGKFTTGSWNVNWGTSGTPGVLQLGGFGNDIPFNVAATGIYRFYFNTDTLAYTFARAAAPATYAAWAAQYGLAAGSGAEDGDQDGLDNNAEFTANADPANADTDSDGLSDQAETSGQGTTATLGVAVPTSPISPDTDGDGLPDAWEIGNYLDPTDNGSSGTYTNYIAPAFGLTVTQNPNGGASNPDADALTNLQEFAGNKNPIVAEGDVVSTYPKIVVAGSFVQTKPNGDWDEAGNPSNTMLLVSNFTWKLIFRVNPVPTFAQFKFTTGSWSTNWGDNIPQGGAADGIGDLNGNNINALPVFTAAGYYAIVFNDFTKAYTIAPVTTTDADADGLPDEYEAFYGGQLATPTTDLVPATDYNGDGKTTAQNYADGTNPVKDVVAPVLALAPGVDKVTWYSVGATIPDPNAADVVATDDVTTSPAVTILSPLPDNSINGFNTVIYQATDATGNYTLFRRVIVVGSAAPGYYNLRYPAATSVNTSSSDNAYGEIFIANATPGTGQATGVQAWVGVNSNNTDPSTWDPSAWTASSYVGDEGNNDNYAGVVSGVGRAPGTYYYATRFQLGTNSSNTNYFYGGITTNGVANAWGSVTNTNNEVTTYGNGVLTVQAARQVTFAVNMNVQTNKSLFDPATQGVEVRGSFGGWAGGSALTNSNNSGIYTGTFLVAGDNGATNQYKFVRTGPGTNAPVFEPLANNRTFTLAASDQTLASVFFNNDDGIGPVISLNGSSPVNLIVGDSYTDAGATATDAIDGSVTATPTGTVDTSVAGTYTITYSAVDAAGNAAIAITRTVIVAAAANPYDTWANQNGLAGAGALPTADPDNDGHTNNEEYAFGGNPNTANPSLLATTISGSNMIVSWFQRADAAAGAYKVKTTTNLSTTAFAVNDTLNAAVQAGPATPPPGYVSKQVSVAIVPGERNFLALAFEL